MSKLFFKPSIEDIFIDQNNDAVSFKGSSNEALSGWHERGNFESLEVFCSWKSYSDAERVRKYRQFFSELWSNQVKEIQTYSFPEALRKNFALSLKIVLMKWIGLT